MLSLDDAATLSVDEFSITTNHTLVGEDIEWNDSSPGESGPVSSESSFTAEFDESPSDDSDSSGHEQESDAEAGDRGVDDLADLNDDTDSSSLGDWDGQDEGQSLADAETNADLSANENGGWGSSNFSPEARAVPIEVWDPTCIPADLEDTEFIGDGSEPDYSLDGNYNIPLDVQLHWLEWMLYEMDDCIDAFRLASPRAGTDGVALRGNVGPYENISSLVRLHESNELYHLFDVGETFYDARNFRNSVEHRDSPMQLRSIHSAIRLPRILNDKACEKRLRHVYTAITTQFQKTDSDSSTCTSSSSSNRSVSEQDEKDFEEVYRIITQPISFDHSPLFGLLYNFVESLKLATFKWATRTHPEYFPTDCHYKAIEPRFWANEYPYRYKGNQCEESKAAFPDNNICDGIMERTFKDCTEIRNYFIHRKPLIEQNEANSRSSKSRFWNMKRTAVKLALLLGDVDLALRLDVDILTFHSDCTRDDILSKFEQDGVEAAVKGLMSGSGKQREAVLSSELFQGETAFRKEMRRRWVTLDVLIEGEYMIRLERDGLETVGADESSTDTRFNALQENLKAWEDDVPGPKVSFWDE